jgi:hypothetical protein
VAVIGQCGAQKGSSKGKIPCSLMTFDRVLRRGKLKRVGPWYGKMGVVSEAPRKKSRGIKEFYPFLRGPRFPT